MTQSSDGKVDAITVEIVRNGLLAATSEMKTNLMRTAYNMIIYEALDFTVGLFTPQGETVSIGLGLPMFIRGMSETVKATIAHIGPENIRAGDIYITNDAYLTGSHLNHVTLTQPVFDDEGSLVAFTCCMAHWLDIGGALSGVTTDIYSEGLQIPILKYRDAGQVNQGLVELIAMNVRLPGLALGDLRAQVTAVTTGERRFVQLVRRYGRAQVQAAIATILDNTDATARAALATIPEGEYEAESFLDDDGLQIGVRVPIRVKVNVAGGRMTIDLSDVGEQVGGFYNSGHATGVACAQVAYKCLTTPTSWPVNDGSFRSLDVVMPPGRVVSALRPAPMRWWMTYPMTVIDTIFKALSPAVPDRVIAGHNADLLVAMIHGVSPTDGRFYIGGIGPTGGGWGAKSTSDGESATVCINDGDTHNTPTEQIESKYPLLVERYALRPDSGGAGRHRGGLGADLEISALAPLTFGTTVERVHCKPWGLHGGLAGDGNKVAVRNGSVWQHDFPNGKLNNQRLKRGDRFLLRASGGGGFGSPIERNADAVGLDVAEGYVSIEAAARDYAVICNATGHVDADATAATRAARVEPGPREAH